MAQRVSRALPYHTLPAFLNLNGVFSLHSKKYFSFHKNRLLIILLKRILLSVLITWTYCKRSVGLKVKFWPTVGDGLYWEPLIEFQDSEPKNLDFRYKTCDKNECPSLQHRPLSSTHQFNTKKTVIWTPDVFCLKLTVFLCWTNGCVELTLFMCWNDAFVLNGRICVELTLFCLKMTDFEGFCVELRLCWTDGDPLNILKIQKRRKFPIFIVFLNIPVWLADFVQTNSPSGLFSTIFNLWKYKISRFHCIWNYQKLITWV